MERRVIRDKAYKRALSFLCPTRVFFLSTTSLARYSLASRFLQVSLNILHLINKSTRCSSLML